MATRVELLRRAVALEYATVGWNTVEVGAAVTAGIVAHSVALMGFGLDALVEIFASVVVVWELRGTGGSRERPGLRLIGGAFFLVAGYVLAESVRTLATSAHPDSSPWGIVSLAATAVIMLTLAWAKGGVGRELANPVVQAEARVSLVDAYLAGSILVGLVANAALGWWWADPVAALVVVYFGVTGGLEAWRKAARA